jgi:hypothetical protein
VSLLPDPGLAKLAQDLGYGDTAHLSAVAEEVSRLLGAYAAAILAPRS